MAMKSVNSWRSLTAAAILSATVISAGCASKNLSSDASAQNGNAAAAVKTPVVDGVVKKADVGVELMDTRLYLPLQKRNEKGDFIPYVAADNPYLVNKSQVNKGSVLLFIEAQKAWRAEDYDTVKQKLNVIVKKDKGLSGPWVMLSRLALKDNDFKLAQEHLHKALSINAQNVNAYPLLAQAQRQLGKYNQAQNTLAHALKLWPDFPEAHYNLAILYDVYLNLEAEAQQHLEAYMFLEQDIEIRDFAWLQDIAGRTGVVASSVGEKPEQSAFLQQASALLAEDGQ